MENVPISHENTEAQSSATGQGHVVAGVAAGQGQVRGLRSWVFLAQQGSELLS